MKKLALILVLLLPLLARAQVDTAAKVSRDVEKIEQLLKAWQFIEARELAQELLNAHPDLPAVQLAAGWVKFHFAEHQAAADLFARAAKAFGGKMEHSFRASLVKNASRVAKDFVRIQSPDGRVVVFHRPGVEEILVPYLIDTVERTIATVGKDFGYRPQQPILVEILPDSASLGELTGLSVEEIKTSGTIAVCKYGRLMVTSPRATLKGYGWLDTASHELVHMIISQKTLNQTPIWIHEALAKFQERRWRSDEEFYWDGLAPHRQSNLAKAIKASALITFEQMHPSMALLPSAEAAELAFSEVYMAAKFWHVRKGYQGIREMLEQLGKGKADIEAIKHVYGFDKQTFVTAWMNWMKSQRLISLTGDPVLAEETKNKRRKDTRGERALAAKRNVQLRDNYHLGQLLRARNRTRAAVVEYSKAVKRAGPRHAALWLLSDKLGLALMAINRQAEARNAFAASLTINPLDLEAHLNLAKLLIDKEPEKAWPHLVECLRINPVDPRVHRWSFMLAKKMVELGNDKQDWSAIAKQHKKALGLLYRQGDRSRALADSGQPLDEQAASSTIRIHTNPWARIWLDFKDTGLTSPVYKLSVTPGSHVIGLKAACNPEPIIVQVHVEPGQIEIIDRQLCPAAQDDQIPKESLKAASE
ncbi:MAG: hypothetical protein JRJ19_01210 [Deltaproteobacteria bacterium]|nr:hypothetical protein [Deltaproteobacteria bacterium]